MKKVLFILAAVAAIVFASTTRVSAAADSSFDRSLATSGPVTLSVSTGAGGVHVHSGSDNQVHIVAHLRASQHTFGDNDVEERIRQIAANPPIRQMGSVISVGPEHNDPLFHDIIIDYDVTTPKATTLHAQSGSGSVQVNDIAQDVNAGTGSGEIQAENLGAKAHLQTGSGSIHAQNVHGDAELQTGSGEIQLQETGLGEVKAQTGSGSIHLTGLQRGLNAHTGSGEITAQGQPTAEWRLITGSGSVRLDVGSSAHFKLDAETGSGSLHVDQPLTMQGKIDRHHISGTVGGGGPEMSIQTGSGDIQIR